MLGTQVHCDLAAPLLVLENFYPCSSLGQTLRGQSKIGSADLEFLPTLATLTKEMSRKGQWAMVRATCALSTHPQLASDAQRSLDQPGNPES